MSDGKGIHVCVPRTLASALHLLPPCERLFLFHHVDLSSSVFCSSSLHRCLFWWDTQLVSELRLCRVRARGCLCICLNAL